jgi:anti-sigma regulatory factor (Ser/Thr protein kinase)
MAHASYEVRARFPADPASAAKARRLLDETLRSWRCEALVDVATLLVSELVANAILHAGTTIEVVARVVPQRLRIEVHDDNPRMPVRKHYSNLSGTGRGLLLVERLAADWGAEATESGKRVWFELDQSPSGSKEEVQLFAFDEFDLQELARAEKRDGSEHDRGGSGGSTAPRLAVLVRTPW